MNISSTFKYYFYWVTGLLSAFFFVASVIVHILTFWNINIQEVFPYVFLLHIGIFIVAIPNFLIWKLEDMKTDEPESLLETKDENLVQINNTKSSLFPILIIFFALLLMPYIAFNFFTNLFLSDGDPEIRNGTYVLKTQGDYKEITKEEYDMASAKLLRGFSGHWLFFYLFITLILFKEVLSINKIERRKE